MVRHLFLFTLIFIATAVTCLGQDDYRVVLSKIDNQAKVFVNDSLIYDSGIIAHNPDLEITIPIENDLIKDGTALTILGFNGTDNPTEKDKHWEIKYSLFHKDTLIDFVAEARDNYKSGLVFEMNHQLNYTKH